MAARCDSTDSLSRTTVLPTITACTLMTWVNLIVNSGTAIQSALSFGNATAFYALGLGVSGTLKQVAFNDSGLSYSAATLTTGTWYHMAMTCSGTGAGALLIYGDGVLNQTLTADAVVTAASIYVGNNQGGDACNCRVAGIKVYSAVLTADEIKAEMRVYMPVRTANLLSWHPMLLHTDVSQYGATWTVGGTLATEQGPPIAWSLRPTMPRRSAGVVAHPSFPGFRNPWRRVQQKVYTA